MTLLGEVEGEERRVAALLNFDKSSLYSTLHNDFNQIFTEVSNAIDSYKTELKKVAGGLRIRQSNPFKTLHLGANGTSESEVEAAFAKLIPLLETQTKKTEGLASDQANARTELRLGSVSSFIKSINLSQIDADIATLTAEVKTLNFDAIEAKRLASGLEREIEELRKLLRDERRGAEKVNQFLTHYFGHDSLKLVAVDEVDPDKPGVRFEIRRGATRAYNLSDGECSLIAFCYYIAKLQDADTEGKQLIIYIDDPISSLDSDHIFFAFSLIQGLIASPAVDASGNKVDRYKQLFISTHNLDFLKFLKRLIRPQLGGNEHFILVRTGSGSLLELMPFYLRHYVTEFYYLFDQICACTDTSKASEDHHCFFSFGNNLRKFLEVYLFFKFPFCENSSGDYNKRVERFFDDDPASEPMVMRVTNELSHGGEAFDRSVRPIEHAEISKMAVYVLRKVRGQDKEQYSDLLQATSRIDPLPAA